MKQLLPVRRFANDPQSVLTAVYWLAFVGIKLVANTGKSRVVVCQRLGRHTKLSVAAFADSECCDATSMFNDPQFAIGHVQSLAHREGRS